MANLWESAPIVRQAALSPEDAASTPGMPASVWEQAPIVKPAAGAEGVVPLEPIDVSPTPVKEQGAIADILSSGGRGWNQTQIGLDAVQYSLGLKTGADFAAAVAQNKRDAAAYAISPELQAAQEQYAQAEGPLGKATTLVTNPRLLASTITESLMTTVPSVGAGLGAGLVGGGPLGAILGAAGGAALSEYGIDFVSFLEDHGVDTNNPVAMQQALENDQLVGDATAYALKRSGVAAALTGAAGVGGEKLVGLFLRPGAGLARKAAGVGVAAGLAGAEEAGTELFGDLWTGDPVDWGDTIAQGLIGSVVDLPITLGPTTLEIAASRRGRRTDVIDFGAPEVPPAAGVAQPPQVQAGAEALREPQRAAPSVAGPTFYSPLSQAISERGPGAATGAEWSAFIANAPGVKAAEVEDTKIGDFLNENAQQRVSKEEMQRYVAENSVMIRTRTLYELQMQPSTEPGKVVYGAPDGSVRVEYDPATAAGPGGFKNTPTTLTVNGAVQHFNSVIDALNAAREYGARFSTANPINIHSDDPRNYREVLVTQLDNTFNGPHWSERGILVSARTQDFTNASAGRGLFVNEIQSDMHQTGREKGYSGAIDEKAKAELDATIQAKEMEQHGLVEQSREAAISGDYTTARALAARATTLFRERVGLEETRNRMRQVASDPTLPPATSPFKATTAWTELGVKQLLRIAADEGYNTISFTNPELQLARYRFTPDGKEARGQTEYYGKIVPQVVRKLAKRLGLEVTEEVLPVTIPRGPTDLEGTPLLTSVLTVKVDPRASSVVRSGLPLYAKPAAVRVLPGKPAKWRDVLANEGVPFLDEMRRIFKIKRGIVVQTHSGLNADAMMHVNTWGGGWKIDVWGDWFGRKEELITHLAHEFGHILAIEKFESLPYDMQQKFRAAHENFLQAGPKGERFRTMRRRRDNAITAFYRTGGTLSEPVWRLKPDQRKYWTSFDEFFAEQVAKWFTSSDKALTVVDTFFKGVAQVIRRVYVLVAKRFPTLNFKAEDAIHQWLDSYVTDAPPAVADMMVEGERRSRIENTEDMKGHGDGEPPPGEANDGGTTPPRDAMNKLFGGDPPREVRSGAAHADYFNRFIKWMISIVQLAKMNPNVPGLLRYVELSQKMHQLQTALAVSAQQVQKVWVRLGKREQDRLAAVLDEVKYMTYLTEEERLAKVSRMPTDAELQAIFNKYGLRERGAKAFWRTVGDWREGAQADPGSFRAMLDAYESVALEHALRSSKDLQKQAEAVKNIQEQFADLRSRPWLPSMWFGDFLITIKDKEGHIYRVEAFDSEHAQRRRAKELAEEYPADMGFEPPIMNKVDEYQRGVYSVPSALLSQVAETLNLSSEQLEQIKQLQESMASYRRIPNRLKAKEGRLGYSTDFKRVHAATFFYGGRYLAKSKFGPLLKSEIESVATAAADPLGTSGNKLSDIANFMRDHYAAMLQPKGDFARLRGGLFMWALAYNPAAAALNLSQTVFGTLPFLSSKFGDVRTASQILRAATSLGTYYKVGKFEALAEGRDPSKLAQMMDVLIKDGTITEAMAPELAAASHADNLKAFTGGQFGIAWSHVKTAGASLFQLAEQWNRRVAAIAAWHMAQANPNVPYVAEAVKSHQLLYDELRARGISHPDTAAIVVAKDAVEATQFIYSKWAQPRFMRGPGRAVFAFKTFVQNTLFFLWQYPSSTARAMLIYAFLGGLMGIPGAEDLADVLKAVAYKLFGKDFDLERETRKFVVDTMNLPPDVMLHGASRYGFGLPLMMHEMGVPFPTLDRSNAVGIGQISPVNFSDMLGIGAANNPEGAIAGTTQRASGALFSVFFNMYKAMQDWQLSPTDTKRWEKAMPAVFRNVSRMGRALNEGVERTRNGAAVIRYDPTDPEQMAETIALGLGYTPTRLNQKWDLIAAQREVEMFWDIQRQMLINQFDWAVQSESTEDRGRVLAAIRRWNASLPQEARAKRITADTLRASRMARERARRRTEMGLSSQKSNLPIDRAVQRLYPEAQVTATRQVRSSGSP